MRFSFSPTIGFPDYLHLSKPLILPYCKTFPSIHEL